MKEKELVLQDLSARLPYGVIVETYTGPAVLDTVLLGIIFQQEDGKLYRPYLRPMESMTEEEKNTYKHIAPGLEWIDGIKIPNKNQIDWLNANHFDWRGLISLNLAIAVTKENNPYEYFYLSFADIRHDIEKGSRNLPYPMEENAYRFLNYISRHSKVQPQDISKVQVPSPYDTIVIDIQRPRGLVSIEIGLKKIGFFTDYADGINEESDGIATDFRTIPEKIMNHLK